MGNAVKFGLIMMLVGLAAAMALVGVRLGTEPRIEAQRRMEEQEALREVLPEASSGVFEAVKEGERIIYYRGYASSRKERVVGYAFLTSGKGYSSIIHTMVGLCPHGKITGIKILSQKETPGLGAKVEEVKTEKTIYSAIIGFFRKEAVIEEEEEIKPWFQKQFQGKDIKDLWVVRGEVGDKIQAITGATISSQAVTDSVRERAEEILALIRAKEER